MGTSRRVGLRLGVWALALLSLLTVPAHALDALEVSDNSPALDLTRAAERLRGEQGRLTVRTAPDAEGVVRRIEVRGTPNGSNEWVVFALSNTGDEQLDRLLVAPHHRLVNSGWWRPDMGASRIRAITPSEGFALERQPSEDADVFLITLDPGATITYAAELTGSGASSLPRLTLWQPDAFKERTDAFTLFHGIVLGIAGLLAVFLTVLFVVRGHPMFPATALLSWAVLAYAALDFGFVEQVAPLAPADERMWRALLEVLIASSLAVFLFAYLGLGRHARAWWAFAPCLAGLAALAGVATFDPALAAGLARLSLALAALAGLVLVAVLGLRGDDRAILLVPTWALVAAWVWAAWAVVTGAIDNDVAQPALVGGLVLIVLLVAFTVTQHAFTGAGAALAVSDAERRALALAGSGDAMFDWEVAPDRIRVDDVVARSLGLAPAALRGPVRGWLPHLHAEDRDRFMNALTAVTARARGRIDLDLRMRGDGGEVRYNLRARPVLGTRGAVARCTGTLTDVTRERTGRDELMRDAVHDNLTGLPLREILLDRTRAAIALAEDEEAGANASASAGPGGDTVGVPRPTMLIVDLDRFAHVNETFGLRAGDDILLAMARRIGRIARPPDCVARLGGDRFAVLLLSRSDPESVAGVAESLRAAVSSPVAFAGSQIALTASIGVASWSAGTDAAALMADAEIAVEAAKGEGGDRIVPFRSAMRAFGTRDYHLENDLRHAIARDEMVMLFQPIVRLGRDGEPDRLAGFEALMRWQSPTHGLVGPADFIPLAERSGLIEELGAFALQRAGEALRDWLEADCGLFVAVNVSSRQLVRHALIDAVRDVIARHALPERALKLELTESLVMENPERAALVLERVREAGASLALDDFGTGYSSLGHLTRFPFDTLKIDRSLVQGVRGERPAVLRAVVQMARDLGLDAVAEGAETPADIDDLRALGVPCVQGFALGEPLDAEAALARVRRDATRARQAGNEAPPGAAAPDRQTTDDDRPALHDLFDDGGKKLVVTE